MASLVDLALFAFSGLGALAALVALWPLVSAILSVVVPRGRNLKKFGQWAVVTGASEGIGFGFAKALAAKGLNVVLVSRSEDKLEKAMTEIHTKYPNVDVKFVAVDLASGAESTYETLTKTIKDLDVGVLVNNAGRSYEHAEYLHELPAKDIDALIELNVRSLTKITHLVLPRMVASKRGAIVNVSSAAGVLPTGNPLYTVYSATKAYVDFFSRSLAAEVRSSGVHVQCVVPYYVATVMSKIRSPTLFAPSADTFARAAVANIGYETFVVPYWVHKIEHAVYTRLPAFFLQQQQLSMNLGIRKRALAKKAKQT